MSGFTLHETLRILVPGILGTIILDFALRITTGRVLLQDDTQTTDLELDSLIVFSGLALAIGLLLYALDLSAKMRIQNEGDPIREFPIPSAKLKSMLGDSSLAENPLGLYFILSDNYLPMEMHKRVYLFGSLYRIFVDLRILLALAAIGSAVASALLGQHSGSGRLGQFDWESMAAGFTVVFVLIVVGSYGVKKHAHNYDAKRKREKSEDRYRHSQRSEDLKRSAGVGTLVVVAEVVGGTLLLNFRWIGALLGSLLCASGFMVWVAAEIGPPQEENETLRDRVLTFLRAVKPDQVQYTPIQRLVFDLSLFVPTMWFASMANAYWDRPTWNVLVYALLLIPCVGLMSLRKHEERLLHIYKEQSLWLELHKKDIERIKADEALPDRWGGPEENSTGES